MECECEQSFSYENNTICYCSLQDENSDWVELRPWFCLVYEKQFRRRISRHSGHHGFNPCEEGTPPDTFLSQEEAERCGIRRSSMILMKGRLVHNRHWSQISELYMEAHGFSFLEMFHH